MTFVDDDDAAENVVGVVGDVRVHVDMDDGVDNVDDDVIIGGQKL